MALTHDQREIQKDKAAFALKGARDIEILNNAGNVSVPLLFAYDAGLITAEEFVRFNGIKAAGARETD